MRSAIESRRVTRSATEFQRMPWSSTERHRATPSLLPTPLLCLPLSLAQCLTNLTPVQLYSTVAATATASLHGTAEALETTFHSLVAMVSLE